MNDKIRAIRPVDFEVAEREVLPGQKEGVLVPVHCENPECGINQKTGVNTGGTRLLGRFYPGTKAELKCPRCSHINRFVVLSPDDDEEDE